MSIPVAAACLQQPDAPRFLHVSCPQSSAHTAAELQQPAQDGHASQRIGHPSERPAPCKSANSTSAWLQALMSGHNGDAGRCLPSLGTHADKCQVANPGAAVRQAGRPSTSHDYEYCWAETLSRSSLARHEVITRSQQELLERGALIIAARRGGHLNSQRCSYATAACSSQFLMPFCTGTLSRSHPIRWHVSLLLYGGFQCQNSSVHHTWLWYSYFQSKCRKTYYMSFAVEARGQPHVSCLPKHGFACTFLAEQQCCCKVCSALCKYLDQVGLDLLHSVCPRILRAQQLWRCWEDQLCGQVQDPPWDFLQPKALMSCPTLHCSDTRACSPHMPEHAAHQL